MRFSRRNRIDKKCNLDKNYFYRNFINAKGYWYSLGRAWYDYWYVVRGEKITTQVVCEVTLPKNIFTTLKKREEGKILVIDSVEDVKILTKEFGEPESEDLFEDRFLINYKLLVKKLKIKGIEFRKYDEIRRKLMNTDDVGKWLYYERRYVWFLDIMVNSGCVWDPSILEVKTVGKLKDFV